jgi:hypothetical protein
MRQYRNLDPGGCLGENAEFAGKLRVPELLANGEVDGLSLTSLLCVRRSQVRCQAP